VSSTLEGEDVQVVHTLVAAARAVGLTRFSGSFPSQSPMHKTGYSQVKFAWERGRHGDKGSINIEWDARLRIDERFEP
jgi:hypothetical protein